MATARYCAKCYSDKEMDMSIVKLARITGTAAVLVAVPLVEALAQTQSPAPPGNDPPAATQPSASPATPQATPSTTSSEKKPAAAAATTANLVGIIAKSSDGADLGKVQSVMTEPGGKNSIGLKVGGFLGFGGHIVAVPDGKFNRVGDTVQVNMTADEVDKLPQTRGQK
jgi:hypothetical protein